MAVQPDPSVFGVLVQDDLNLAQELLDAGDPGGAEELAAGAVVRAGFAVARVLAQSYPGPGAAPDGG